MTAETPPSTAIIRAVAAEEGLRAVELDPPLFDAVDPDAVDTLFRNTTGVLTFEYLGYTVTVDEGGTVDVAEGDGT